MKANFLAVVLVLAGKLAAEPLPSWTASDGRTIQAQFVRLDGEAVVIRKGTQEFTIRFAQLSASSVALAKQLAAAEGRPIKMLAPMLPNESGRVILCRNSGFNLVGEVGKDVRLTGRAAPGAAKPRQYQWRQCLEGEAVRVDLRDANKQVATFKASKPGCYKFEFEVVEGTDRVSTERVSVFVGDELNNANFELGEGERPNGWETWASDKDAVRFGWDRNGGIGGTRCLSISADQAVRAEYRQEVQLAPFTQYLLRGRIKAERLRTTGKRAAAICLWGAEDGPAQSTTSCDWTLFETSMATGETGRITVYCRLGAGDSAASGTVYFDNLTLVRDPKVATFEGEHFILHMPDDLLALAGRRSVEQMLPKVDAACEAMSELTGNKHGNVKQSAWYNREISGGCSGNPLNWGGYSHALQNSWPRDAYCPEIFLHELGHNYTHAGEFNAEFAMAYALETCNLAIDENGWMQGKDTRGRWKARSVSPGDGCDVLYRLLLLRDKIGWEPFKKLYRHISALPPGERPEDIFNSSKPASWKAIQFWVTKLSEYSGTDCWTVFEDLERNSEGFLIPDPAAVSARRQTVALVNTKWQSAKVGWDSPRCGVYETSDRDYEKSIWAHAPSDYVYELGGQFRTLTGGYGLNRGSEQGSVMFVVKGDNKELFRSKLIKGEAVAHRLLVDVSGVRKLRLIVEEGGDGNHSDAGIWFSPQLDRRSKNQLGR